MRVLARSEVTEPHHRTLDPGLAPIGSADPQAASGVVGVNNEDEEVDLSTLGAGGIPVGFADGAVIEITGAETDLSVSGGLLIGNMPARSSYLVSDQ